MMIIENKNLKEIHMHAYINEFKKKNDAVLNWHIP